MFGGLVGTRTGFFLALVEAVFDAVATVAKRGGQTEVEALCFDAHGFAFGFLPVVNVEEVAVDVANRAEATDGRPLRSAVTAAKGNAGLVLQRGLDVGGGATLQRAPVLDRCGGVRVAFAFDGDGFKLGRFLRLAGSGKERQ